MMKKLYKIAGALLITFIIISCSGITGNIVKDNTITAGVIVPLTGGAASYGDETQKGMTIAMDEFALQNIPVKVYYEDGCLADSALKAAQKLIHANNVDFISGVFCIASVHPIASIAQSTGTSVMMSAAMPDTVIANNQVVFDVHNSIKDEANAQAEFAYKKLGARTASFIWLHTDFGKSFETHFRQRFEELGGTIYTDEAVALFTGEFRSEITKATANNPDVIVAIHFGDDMSAILKQLKEIGYKGDIIGDYETEDPKIVEVTGNALEGVYISTPSIKSTKHDEFRMQYMEKYGEEPTVVAMNAYDGLVLQVEAHIACKGIKVCMLKHLGNVQNHNGASGTFSMNEDHAADKEIVFKQVVDGKFVLVN